MLSDNDEAKIRIAKRVAREFDDADQMFFINTGVGIPTMVTDYITNKNVFVQAENGILGVGHLARGDEIDDQLINAGRQPVTESPGCSYMDSSGSFGMIRGGHIDATIIGAFEVDEEGNIANWIIPNGKQMGVGGAMDLVVGAKKVIVAMQHTGKGNSIKIKKRCTLPITGFGEVDLLVTEFSVFKFKESQMVLTEIAKDITLEGLRAITEAQFIIAKDLKAMEN